MAGISSTSKLPPIAPGQRYGRLVAIDSIEYDARSRMARWRFQCDCGREHFALTGNVRAGRTQSCGCLQNELSAQRETTHGMYGTPEYISWASMIQRCENQHKKNYPNYGGRGIAVCARWRAFEHFLADMGPRPSGTTLDRYPNKDGNYEPDNCRWATAKEQANNRRTRRWRRRPELTPHSRVKST